MVRRRNVLPTTYIAAMRGCYARGHGISELARHYGVHESVASDSATGGRTRGFYRRKIYRRCRCGGRPRNRLRGPEDSSRLPVNPDGPGGEARLEDSMCALLRRALAAACTGNRERKRADLADGTIAP